MHPPRPPLNGANASESTPSSSQNHPATPLVSTQMQTLTRLFAEAVSSDSPEAMKGAITVLANCAMKDLWSAVLDFARSDLQSAQQVVKKCLPTYRRDFVQTLLGFLINRLDGRSTSAQAYLTLCEAEKINVMAIPNLLKLVLLTHKFTFNYTEDIPKLTALLNKNNFTSLDCLFLLCGMGHSYTKENPAENALVDKFLASDVIARPDVKAFFQGKWTTPRVFRLCWERAAHLKQSGGTPPNAHYAQLLFQGGCFANCPDPEHAAWLIAPFHQSHPDTVGKWACSIVFASCTEPLVPEVVSRLSYGELFFFLKSKVSPLAQKLLLERIFENGQLLFMQEKWVENVEDLLKLNNQEAGSLLQDRPISVLINWLTQVPQKRLRNLLYPLMCFNEFPLFWNLFSPEPEVLMPDSDLEVLFHDALNVCPDLRLPRQITAPEDVSVVPNSPLMSQVSYALQFPEQFSRPVVNPQRFLDAMGVNSQDTFGWEQLGEDARFSWSIWCLLHYSDDQAFCAYLSAHLNLLMNCLVAIGDKDFSLTGKSKRYTEGIQILAAVIQQGQPSSPELCEAFNELIRSWLKCFTSMPKTLIRDLLPFLGSLGQIARKAPHFFDRPLDLNAIYDILESLKLSPEEKAQVNAALAAIRKTPGQPLGGTL